MFHLKTTDTKSLTPTRRGLAFFSFYQPLPWVFFAMLISCNLFLFPPGIGLGRPSGLTTLEQIFWRFQATLPFVAIQRHGIWWLARKWQLQKACAPSAASLTTKPNWLKAHVGIQWPVAFDKSLGGLSWPAGVPPRASRRMWRTRRTWQMWQRHQRHQDFHQPSEKLMQQRSFFAFAWLFCLLTICINYIL